MGDFDVAEDALQEAFEAALAQWAAAGPPQHPVAWLVSTARHKAIDVLRRRSLAEGKRDELAAWAAPEDDAPVPLDSLRLVFTCCHPALAPEAQVALTLRTVCGLDTDEIARAFLVPLPTLAQRLVRAKAKIKIARIPYEVPGDEVLAERLGAVMAVVYLVFNEGYSASFGDDLVRADLCAEAIRLARMLVGLLPGEREPKGLLALMLFHDARRATRTDAEGAIVLLEEQDRSRWDAAKIAEGSALLEQALRGRPTGPYAVQAAIAALHARARSARETDWPQIAALYGVLAAIHPSPVVELNRAVAVAMADGLERGLALLDTLQLPGYHLLPAARADLLRRLGRRAEAAAAYRQALALVTNDAERRFLERRLAETTGALSGD
ncbi:RNA polymerase sigma factor [Anaeromyxobacter terrae]|uniref:RNA polymerase sigma factor n=1 Tax=Anaeromyxobacter terrae TaxID=2925406 RepID=UPI001F581A99